jgi:hypothetical protein
MKFRWNIHSWQTSSGLASTVSCSSSGSPRPWPWRASNLVPLALAPATRAPDPNAHANRRELAIPCTLSLYLHVFRLLRNVLHFCSTMEGTQKWSTHLEEVSVIYNFNLIPHFGLWVFYWSQTKPTKNVIGLSRKKKERKERGKQKEYITYISSTIIYIQIQ